jgi:DNA-binding LacI/PurR family transcriptional regulator
MEKTRKRVTLKDIAQKAGVSHMTVSYVLNNTPGVTISPETRKRVLEAAEALNYSPNFAAQRLRVNKANCIAVRIVSNLYLQRYHMALQSIRHYFESIGYSILLCNDEQDPISHYPQYITACLNTQADGLIYIVAYDETSLPEDVLDTLQKKHIPFCVIDPLDEIEEAVNIRYDYFGSTFERANALIHKGYTHFLYTRPEYKNPKEDLRERGIKAAVYSLDGLSLDIASLNGTRVAFSAQPGDVLRPESDFSFRAEARQIVEQASPDTAILSSSQEIQDAVSMYLYLQSQLHPELYSHPWYERTLNYFFSHFEAGMLAAQELDQLLHGEEWHSHIIHPNLLYTNADSF